MAVTLHSSVRYRSYKKIHGSEYQYYSDSFDLAIQKQKEYESLSQLATPSKFRGNGTLIGFSINLYSRKGRKPTIIMRMALGPAGSTVTAEYRYTGSFKSLWEWTLKRWKQYYDLLPQDMASFRGELKRAKQQYIRQIGALEDQISAS